MGDLGRRETVFQIAKDSAKSIHAVDSTDAFTAPTFTVIIK